MIILKILISILCGLLFRLGGVGKDDRFLPFMNPPTPIAAKVWRWLGIGVVISLYIWSLWPLLTYLMATWVISYGDKHPFRKWFGWHGQMLIYGFCFGFASFPGLGISGALVQALISMVIFWLLMLWSNEGIVIEEKDEDYGRIGRTWQLDQAWVEVLTGVIGTILFWFVR